MTDIVRGRIMFDLDVTGEFAGMGFHLMTSIGGSSTAQLESYADAVWDWWDVGVQGGVAAKTLFVSSVDLAAVTMQRIASTVGPLILDDRANIPGTNAGSSVSPQVAIVASFRTGVSARRQRGRMFLPYPPISFVNQDGTMSAANATLYRDVVIDLFDELKSAGRLVVPNTQTDHVIWSTGAKDPDPPNDPLPAAAFEVTTYLVGRRVDTQRRRLGKEQAYV